MYSQWSGPYNFLRDQGPAAGEIVSPKLIVSIEEKMVAKVIGRF